MKITWCLGVAALTMAGCAGYDQSATVIDPTVSVESLASVANAPPPATIDQPVATDPGPAPVVSATVDPMVNTDAQLGTDGPACVNVASTAGSMAAADALGGCARGMLAADEDGHYFTFAPTPDVSYRVTLAHSGSATFDIGTVVTAEGRTTCVPFSSGLVDARVTVTADSRPVCVVVRADGEPQGFTITAVP